MPALSTFKRNLIPLVILFSLTSCTINPATGDKSFTGLMSLSDEIRIGREEHIKILKAFGGRYKDNAITNYVNSIGNRLAATSELPNIKWTFTVLNSPVVNALALPGGYVYVTRGLMALASSESELAGVIAHEIGHVTARHAAQRYSSSILAGGVSMAAGVFLGSSAGDIAKFASNAAMKSYSRKQEFEADTLGVRYLARGNYNTTSIEEMQPKIGLNEFYPNPSVNKTSIKYVAERNSQLDIIDILGNKVKSFDLDNSGVLDISTSDLSSGIYFGNLVVHKRVVAVKKLIIN